MEFEPGVPETLRALRRERGLSLAGAARRSGLSVNTVWGWEVGGQPPTGRSLDRLLEALEAPERTRARLLARVAPRYARLALAGTALGSPVSLGTVLRAMRRRRGITQTDFARTVGVTQGTVARWESGDVVPLAETLHGAAFALGASVEEAVALVSAQGGPPDGLPDEPGPVHPPPGLSPGLREIVTLGLEGEVWRRATRDARWEPTLGGLLARRADLCAYGGRFAEVPDLAERALRLATTPEGRAEATPAVNALAELSLHRGGSPLSAARLCGDWAARLSRSDYRAWMLGNQGLYLIRAGRHAEGIDRAFLACDANEASAATEPWRAASMRAEMMGVAYLEAGMAEAAADAVVPHRYRDVNQLVYARVEHANGRPLDPASLAYVRHFALRAPENVGARAIERMERIEREQARLTGEPVAPVAADPAPDAATAVAEGRRLWAAVPGGRAWMD